MYVSAHNRLSSLKRGYEGGETILDFKNTPAMQDPKQTPIPQLLSLLSTLQEANLQCPGWGSYTNQLMKKYRSRIKQVALKPTTPVGRKLLNSFELSFKARDLELAFSSVSVTQNRIDDGFLRQLQMIQNRSDTEIQMRNEEPLETCDDKKAIIWAIEDLLQQIVDDLVVTEEMKQEYLNLSVSENSYFVGQITSIISEGIKIIGVKRIAQACFGNLAVQAGIKTVTPQNLKEISNLLLEDKPAS